MKILRVIGAALVFMMLPLAVVASELTGVSGIQDNVALLASYDQFAITLFGMSLTGKLAGYLVIVFAVIGLASALVRVLEPLAKYTSTKRDDELLGKASGLLIKVHEFISKYLALNPKK
ncbi:hypothetical protein NFHSH190041_36910 (plasmid) [Shewanella sp. NFH-SH190041]|uniref:hypothetical protein n=1 Tax=Shewanella sp. NFH-SH190041 TaxID=2950245 RepID=UPI0021C3B9F1|nr:hypothetical protein [Shewanella sp. NFH-SH190041]BDM66239.1 hypothetical protein NFHSH190041_36910 [Shewanella sp. NFH-SH190041]